MNPKMHWKTALKLAKSRGYDGEETFDAVKSWWGSDLVNEQGKLVEIVKEVVVSIAATEGESVRVEDASASEDQNMGQEAAEAEAAKAFRDRQKKAYEDSEIQRLTKHVTAGLTAKNHERIGKRKAYDRAAAKGSARFHDGDTAEMFGAYTKSLIANKLGLDYQEKAYDADVLKKNGLTTTFTAGGALVPAVFEASLIKIRQERGVAERLVGITNMASTSETRPRRTGGVTVYAQTEGSAVTASNPSYGVIELTAKDWMATSYLSVQLLNLSAIDIADETADEHAYAMADKLDDCYFNGDGTSTYFGYQGLRAKLAVATASLQTASGNTYDEITLDDLVNTKGKLKRLNINDAPQWAMSTELWTVAQGEAFEAGGNTIDHVANGMSEKLLGYPVEISEVMPSTAANSQVCLAYGYFKAASKIGQVVGSMRFDVNEGEKFSQGLVAFRTMQQIAINIHDVGDTSTSGPVVGLITASS